MEKKRKNYRIKEPVYFLGLLFILIFSWIISVNGINHFWYYDGFPFSTAFYFQLHSLTAIISIIVFSVIFNFTSGKNRFRSYIISLIITIMELSTIEFYWNFREYYQGVNPYFLSFTVSFLVFGYLNYDWKFFNIDPVLIGLYLFVDGLELVMWLNKFFGLIPSLIVSGVLMVSFTNLAITLSRPRPDVELTL